MSWEGQYIQDTAVHLPAGFVDLGLPVIGAAATIDVWYPGDGAVPTINGVAMTELADGIYFYNTPGLAGVGIYKVRAMIVASNLYAYGSFEIIIDRIGTILTDTNEIQGKLPTNDIMGSSDKADHDDEIINILADTAAMEPLVILNLDAAISAVVAALVAVNIIVTNLDTNLGEPGDVVADGTAHGKLGSTAEFSGHKSVKGEIIDLATQFHTQPL